jgi:hypothetical protein
MVMATVRSPLRKLRVLLPHSRNLIRIRMANLVRMSFARALAEAVAVGEVVAQAPRNVAPPLKGVIVQAAVRRRAVTANAHVAPPAAAASVRIAPPARNSQVKRLCNLLAKHLANGFF